MDLEIIFRIVFYIYLGFIAMNFQITFFFLIFDYIISQYVLKVQLYPYILFMCWFISKLVISYQHNIIHIFLTVADNCLHT